MALNSWSVPGSLSVDQDLIVGKRLVIANAPVQGQVNADWNSTTGLSQILNKPAIYSKKVDWQDLTGFLADISGYVGTSSAAQACVDELGYVRFRGAVKINRSFTTNIPLLTLPTIFRPIRRGVYCGVFVNGASQTMMPASVAPDSGNITLLGSNATTTTFVDLDGIVPYQPQ